ncbi:MAG: hypothetical protein AB9891_02295 [Anaerolineaceae bacterium]
MKEIWLLNASEENLAGYQQNQGRSNNCGEFAAAAAINVLLDRQIPGLELAELADRGWLLKGLRTWPGGPTSPAQQARLIQEYARQQNLPVEVSARKSTHYYLRHWLENPDVACLVTISWDNRRLPKILKGTGGVTPMAESRFFWSGHTMVLAAFQPAGNGNRLQQDRWGFINSWADPSCNSGIFWMDHDEFKRCWNYHLFPIGSHNVVVVRRLIKINHEKTKSNRKMRSSLLM